MDSRFWENYKKQYYVHPNAFKLSLQEAMTIFESVRMNIILAGIHVSLRVKYFGQDRMKCTSDSRVPLHNCLFIEGL